MKNPNTNAAFIDGQNLNLGIQSLGWKLDWRKFRTFLSEKYGVERAFFFIGFIPQYQSLYTSLQKAGFILVFKPVLPARDGKHKGNVDADLVLGVMKELDSYDGAVIVTSDGDFSSLVEHLHKKDKLETVLSPASATCSVLLKKAAKDRIQFLDVQRHKLEFKPQK
ncbi:MAG TPA: NYN domain-containing protein [Gemmatimonadaceae bacterium]|nr:NYN domain-containing protein [Gemmatimonadaceae bacterium]